MPVAKTLGLDPDLGRADLISAAKQKDDSGRLFYQVPIVYRQRALLPIPIDSFVCPL